MAEASGKTRKRQDQLEEELHPSAKRSKSEDNDHEKTPSITSFKVCEGIIEKLFEDLIQKIAISQKLSQNIIDAVLKNNIKEVISLVNDGASIGTRTSTDETLLHLASLNGHTEIVKILLQKGADIMCKDASKHTPLQKASLEGHVEIVQLLLKDCEKYFQTPIPSKNRTDAIMRCVQSLIHAYGCKDGKCESQSCFKMKRVVRHATSCTRKSNGQCPICKQLIALCCYHAERCLDSNCSVQFCVNIKRKYKAYKALDPMFRYKSPPLILASSNGHLDVAQILLQNGAFVNHQGKNMRTALHSASENGHVEMVKLLINHGAHSNIKLENNWTALHLACKNGHVEVAKQLIVSGAEIDCVGNSKSTPLHLAIIEDKIEIVTLLIKYGANSNLLNGPGRSPLTEAIHAGSLEIVALLVENGANMISLDGDGYSPLHKAVKWNMFKVVKCFAKSVLANLKAKDIDGNDSLEVALKSKKRDAAKLLIYHQ